MAGSGLLIRDAAADEAGEDSGGLDAAYRTSSRSTAEDIPVLLAHPDARLLVAELVEGDHPWALAVWESAGYVHDAPMRRYHLDIGQQEDQFGKGRRHGGQEVRGNPTGKS